MILIREDFQIIHCNMAKGEVEWINYYNSPSKHERRTFIYYNNKLKHTQDTFPMVGTSDGTTHAWVRNRDVFCNLCPPPLPPHFPFPPPSPSYLPSPLPPHLSFPPLSPLIFPLFSPLISLSLPLPPLSSFSSPPLSPLPSSPPPPHPSPPHLPTPPLPPRPLSSAPGDCNLHDLSATRI